jgi:hypothetical protein
VVLVAVALDRLGVPGGDTSADDATTRGAVTVDAVAVGRSVRVVRPGETLWAIARAIAPNDDPRAVVDELIALNGGAPLEVGQRLVLPS